ncbi:MAG: recombination protein RecR [Deltaproteobacteria bacterium]|jgi:recombination protein RecR|nr:recombination protein RecR [Deltaproteobacteria bacterium]
MSSAGPIARLVVELAKLPGVGEKTAARLAFHILRAPAEDAAALASAITDLRSKIRLCSRCWNFTEADPCDICRDERREPGLLCVVAHPQDVVAIERTGGYRGRYHVLHGVLSPLDGIGPEDLRIAELVRRCSEESLREVIVATNPSVEGETTAVYLAKLIRPLGVRTSRIATGVPMGGELEYADRLTLARAIDGRREL